jgi:signal transduction histidine kinase
VNLNFQSRLVLFFSVLLVTVQAMTLAVVSWVSRANVMEQLNETLFADERVFSRLLLERSERIANETRLLAADFGFKSTLAANDPATLNSALENLVYRIHGQQGFFIGPEGDIVATTSGRHQGAGFFFPDALQQADAEGRMVFFGTLEDRLYEWAVVPVLAPVPIGSIAIALAADRGLLQHLMRLAPANLDVSLVERSGQGQRIVASSLPQDLQPRLDAYLLRSDFQASRRRNIVRLGARRFITQVQTLPTAHPDQALIALLQIDLEDALQPYAVLFYTVLALLLVGLAATLCGGFFIARTMARPVRMLAGATERLLDGHFDGPITLDRQDEFGRLAETFNRAGRLAAELSDLKRQDQQRRELVADVSHDLRTPLTSLHGYLETMRQRAEGLAPEERQLYLDVAVRQSAKLGRLTQELFELARLECADDGIRSEPFGLAELIQDVIQNIPCGPVSAT